MNQLIDRSRLAVFLEMGPEGQTMVLQIIDLYLTDSKKQFQLLNEHYLNGKNDLVRTIAHKLRSSSGNIGAIDISKNCAIIDEMITNDPNLNLGLVKNQIELMNIIWPDTLAELTRFRENIINGGR